MSHALRSKLALVLASVLIVAAAALATHGDAAGSGFANRVLFNASHYRDAALSGNHDISQPDDITVLGDHLFVGFQNGVGPQGEASPTGNRGSTIVELDLNGTPVKQWALVGKCDGVTADPDTGMLIATVNEDAHSSVYLINPASATAVHYRYDVPLPSGGGTDAITIHDGLILISASAPGTTGKAAPQAAYPAVYVASFDAATRVAMVHGLFGDEATAQDASAGAAAKRVELKLTDPDSNENVPAFAPRFAGEFMLTSQGDEEQIFVADAGGPHQALSVLKLTHSVDDSAWASSPDGAIYTTDNDNDTVNEITGPFTRGEVVAAVTPCDQNGAPATCPAAGYPPNYFGEINPSSGTITPIALSGPTVAPQGMLFLPAVG